MLRTKAFHYGVPASDRHVGICEFDIALPLTTLVRIVKEKDELNDQTVNL